MLRKAFHSACYVSCACTLQYAVQLPRLNDGVECRAFRRFGCGTCPETPQSSERMRVPRFPKEKGQLAAYCGDITD
jgi:hypothetical protein